MMERRGRDFKDQTFGYIIVYTHDTQRRDDVYFTRQIVSIDVRDRSEYVYMYEPEDELWAIFSVRLEWKRKPYLHPHYSLFQAIMTKFPDILKT